MKDYYEILGVSRSATDDQIKRAFRTLVKTTHPDIGGAAHLFELVEAAYRVLIDPSARAAYDAHLDRGPAADRGRSGDSLAPVPDLLGMPYEIAIRRLLDAGLVPFLVGVALERASKSDRLVLGQVPAAGTRLTPGSVIRVEIGFVPTSYMWFRALWEVGQHEAQTLFQEGKQKAQKWLEEQPDRARARQERAQAARELAQREREREIAAARQARREWYRALRAWLAKWKPAWLPKWEVIFLVAVALLASALIGAHIRSTGSRDEGAFSHASLEPAPGTLLVDACESIHALRNGTSEVTPALYQQLATDFVEARTTDASDRLGYGPIRKSTVEGSREVGSKMLAATETERTAAIRATSAFCGRTFKTCFFRCRVAERYLTVSP